MITGKHKQPAEGRTQFFPLPQLLIWFSTPQPAGRTVALLVPDVAGAGRPSPAGGADQFGTDLHPAQQMFNLVFPPPSPPTPPSLQVALTNIRLHA